MIKEDRLKHIIGVARRMRAIVSKYPENYFPVTPEDAFTVGMLHDIGYEFSVSPATHAEDGGILLKKQGYLYWREIYYHGIVQKEYTSILLDLLNYSDMTTNSTGGYVTLEERLDEMVARFGKESIQFTVANEMYLHLSKIKFISFATK